MPETEDQRRRRHEQEALALEEELATIATSRLDADVRSAGASIIAEFLRGRTGKSLVKVVRSRLKSIKSKVKSELAIRLDRAIELGVHQGQELAATAVRPGKLRDPDIVAALNGLDPGVRQHLDSAIVLAETLPLDDRASVLSVLAKSYQAVTGADAGARWAANRAISLGTARVAAEAEANIVWMAERDGCLHCLAYQGQIIEPGTEFPRGLTFGDKPLTPFGKLWFPPLHPNCRCQVDLTYEPVGTDNALVREAQRSIAQGKGQGSEPAIARAADRLLSGPTLLPKSVVARGKRKFSGPAPALVQRAPAKKAPAPVVPTPFADLPTREELAREIMKQSFPKYPENVLESITDYQGAGYNDINQSLREGKPELDEYNAVPDIDRVFDMSPGMPVEGKVFRGMRGGLLRDEDMTGQTVRDLAYMSTSLKVEAAEEFSGSALRVSDASIWEIRLPVGAKAISVQYVIDSLLNETTEPPTMKQLLFYEGELLLPRGTQLKITSDQKRPDGTRLIQAEVVL